MSASTIASRNRKLFEQCKVLGDAVYCEDKGLVLRANVGAAYKDRWGFDVVQSSAWYAVALAHGCREEDGDVQEDRERLNQLLRAMCACQDRRTDSPTYGNIFWRVGWTEVRDRNGVSFWSPEAGLIYRDFKDLLDADVAATLEETLALCVEGLDRHRPRWQYTNIFLLNILSRLTIADALDQPVVRDRAEEDWATWFSETGKGGLTEYNSPTYIVTALCPLARMLDFSASDTLHAQVNTTLDYLFADFAWHYHAASGGLAGAMSRAYPGDYLHNSLSNYVAYQQFDVPLTNLSLSAPFVAASNYVASPSVREAALRDKAGLTVLAAIPDLGIARETAFGSNFAIGVKSGRSYGKQELPITIAHRAKRQHLMFFHHESDVRAPVYSSLAGSGALCVVDYPESDPQGAPPHCWSKFVLGPPSEFESITIDGQAWDGGYVDLNGGVSLGLVTDHVGLSLRAAVRPTEGGEHDTAKVFFWHQYESDELVIECIAWKPSRVAFAIAALDGTRLPDVGPVTGSGSRFATDLPGGTANVRVPGETGFLIDASVPLLATPDVVWKRDWDKESRG